MTTTANASEDVLSFSVSHIHTSTLPEVKNKMHGDAPPASVALKKEENGEVEVHPGGIGLQPQEVYDRQLQPWAAAIRRRLIRNLQWESEVLAAMQNKVRKPFLDAYFVNTSSLGTHTFFMVLLPAFCFFGYHEITRGLIFVLAVGIYLSSCMKDSICAPRPFAPPVHRLTISNHHKEYGFPSTHTVNSVSIALFFWTIVYRWSKTPVAESVSAASLAQNATDFVTDAAPQMVISTTGYWIWVVILVLYAFSIVYGRLYTAMHSFTDCAVGTALGVATWVLYLYYAEPLDTWLKNSGWIVPAVVVPFCLMCVHYHPEPVDDCPCFEDAIAFMSVVMGEFLTRWFMSQYGFDHTFFVTVMMGKPFGTAVEMWRWWSTATLKMLVGVAAIFAWRIFAKFLLHRILPPLYRMLSHLFTLPHRRYYTPATDYRGVPPEKGLRALPSVLDLPGMVELEVDGVDGVSTAPSRRVDADGRAIKLRAGKGGRSEKGNGAGLGIGLEELGGKGGGVEPVRHYDADVLTKVFVYAGIGFIASGGMPIFFELVGWGMRAR
ncbi:hypothetical protein EIP86_008574 [Pleurotus ostreatoroseus]|nr:hypothetical protein EIP86_008574 [Pleurotus ostreatoroseus]